MESPRDRYVREHSSPVPEGIEWIAKQTHIHTNFPQMLSGPVQGELLKILVETSGAERIVEIGSFTGYSAAWMALGLPENGHLDALEINDELEHIMREGWERTGVADKITLHIGDARESLRKLHAEGTVYDFAFMDANKREYCEYFDLLMDLVRHGGLIIADDVLWDGKVYETPLPRDRQTVSLLDFNDKIRRDPRVEVVMLPLRDGLSVIRKL